MVFLSRLDVLLPNWKCNVTVRVIWIIAFCSFHFNILFHLLKRFFVTSRLQDANSLTVTELPQCIASPFAVQLMQCVPAESWGAL